MRGTICPHAGVCVLILLSVLLPLACGGGGSGGGGSGGGSPESQALTASGWIGSGNDGWQTLGASPPGGDARSLDEPSDVAVGPHGSLYVADTENRRISRWAPDGTATGWIGWGKDGWQTGETPGGEPDARLIQQEARSIAVDADGTVYVGRKYSVTRFSPDGTFTGWIGGGRDGWQTGALPESWELDYRSFGTIHGLALDGNGNLYVAEWANHRVSKWSRDGTALGWIGGGKDGWQTADSVPVERSSSGFMLGVRDLRSFGSVQGVFVDGDGDIYTTDFFNWRVSKWDRDGNAIGWIGRGLDGWQTGDSTTSVGQRGIRNFNWPASVFVDGDGTIYIADREHQRISKWDRDGHALGWIGGGQDGWRQDDCPGVQDGAPGEKSFDFPTAVVVAPDGTITVSDRRNHRLSRWDEDGQFIGWVGGGKDGWRGGDAPSPGEDVRSFHEPWGLARTPDGTLYVIDPPAERVVRWSNAGVAGGSLGGGVDGWHDGESSTLAGSIRAFARPKGVWVDGDGTIYVADSEIDRVSKWSADGVALGWIGGGEEGWRTEPTLTTWPSIPNPYGETGGPGARWFDRPLDIVGDSNGLLYIADRENQRITRWDREGRARGWIGGGKSGWQAGSASRKQGPGIGAFWSPVAVAVTDDERLVVADYGNDRVSVWSLGGEPLGWIGGGTNGLQDRPARWITTEDEDTLSLEGGVGQHRFSGPYGVHVRARRLYVADPGNSRVSLWRLPGTPSAQGWLGHGKDLLQKGKAPGGEGTDMRSFSNPLGVATDADGNLYVVDSSNHRVVRWSPAPPVGD